MEGDICSHSEDATECWIQRRKRHLKALTQRWYHLWLRSLSVQCRIEQELNQLYLVSLLLYWYPQIILVLLGYPS